jgi:hypothetical protein
MKRISSWRRASTTQSRRFHGCSARFESFPFDTPADRGVFLAALFTAVLRPGLRTARVSPSMRRLREPVSPLLTDCVAIIGTGSAPSALPQPARR